MLGEMAPRSRWLGTRRPNCGAGALPSRSRNRQYLSRLDQIRVRDATGVGDDLVLVAVAVEPLGDGPQSVAGFHGVSPGRFAFRLLVRGLLHGVVVRGRCGSFGLG